MLPVQGRVGAGSVSLMGQVHLLDAGQPLSLKSVGLAGAAWGCSLLLQIGLFNSCFSALQRCVCAHSRVWI